MRGDIQILPPDRTTVSYDLLAQLVADYLLTHSPDVDISSALSMLPLTTSPSARRSPVLTPSRLTKTH